MGFSDSLNSNSKALALESTLQQSIVNFRELLSDFEQLQVECESYKLQLVTLKHKCESVNSNEADVLKTVIAMKDEIIQSVASSLTKLNDTKDWNVLTETFKILFEAPPSPTYTENKIITQKKDPSPKLSLKKDQKDQLSFKLSSKNQSESIKVVTNQSDSSKDLSITEDISFKEESVCEIEGTPTGRTSPIIHTKKTKSLLGRSGCRDKKMCPDDWPSPNSKMFKSTPTGGKSVRMRQSRINLVKLKQISVVDLTCSPEHRGTKPNLFQVENVMPLIKKESMENEDTILPSPTSGPTSFNLLKTITKDSPSKIKRPLLSLKVKSEKCENELKQHENRTVPEDLTNIGMEDSINLLNQLPNRLRNGIKKEKEMEPPVKVDVEMDVDATHCETDSSISVLGHIKVLQRNHGSPTKGPLAENINVMNTPPKCAASSSKVPTKMATVDHVKRKLPELVEPVYKEPTVRNKLEKKNLQGWSCEECKNFFGELYKNDPVMLAKKINECSKHRGRHNPERPKTPPNFWKPRWHVPEDTEELNRMNNAI